MFLKGDSMPGKDNKKKPKQNKDQKSKNPSAKAPTPVENPTNQKGGKK